jgi:Doubled CXXCH motif (Paired_CXXCH_1)
MIRYIALAAFVAASLNAAPIALPKTALAGTTHDIGGNGCKSCHAPHNGAMANGGPQGNGQMLLWVRPFPATANTFGVYDSATMGNKAVELGGAALTTPYDMRMYSLLCLSCHDGVTSTFSPAMQPQNMIGAKAGLGASFDSMGLTNDHPVNMAYDPSKSSEQLQAVTTVSGILPLYGSNNTIQCSTCHDPHNNSNTNYMRQPNNSSHCTTCHL